MALSDQLLALQDIKYRAFQQKLIPNIDPETIIGVRTPKLRRLAKEMEEREAFLSSLPHMYFEENQIHALLLEKEQDFYVAVSRVDAFLPHVNNWATCDQLRPKVFQQNKPLLLEYINKWLESEHPYTIRYGIAMLMCHYLDEDFDPIYPEWVASVRHDDYYVKMMVAWYFATALAKQYHPILPYIENRKLDLWTHRKAIRKAVESYRISMEQKEYLKQFR